MLSVGSRPLRLYQSEYCYYCVIVRRAAQKLGVKLTVFELYTDSEARARLIAATGRTTVPVLGIMDDAGNERFLAESRDIIKFLEQYASQRASVAS